MAGHDHHHDHDHHDHDHGHHHHEHPRLDELQLRVKALESLLVEKGLVDPAALAEYIDIYETKVGPRNGATAVARAWTAPEFLAWIGRDAPPAPNNERAAV